MSKASILKLKTVSRGLASLSMLAIGNTFFSNGNISRCQQGKAPFPGSDCEVPACADVSKMMQMAFAQRAKMEDTYDKKKKKKVEAAEDQMSTVPHTYKGCPVGTEMLGKSTWNLLHTIAANYPGEPSEEHKENVRQFIVTLSYLYPCPHCQADFQESVEEKPPRLDNHDTFSLWCCELHNAVNAKMGYKTFPCNVKDLDDRWKYISHACLESPQGMSMAAAGADANNDNGGPKAVSNGTETQMEEKMNTEQKNGRAAAVGVAASVGYNSTASAAVNSKVSSRS